MDSGNSGSIQSSSGGDEEYDSRADSISALLNSSGSHGGPMSSNTSLPPPPPPPSYHHPSLFDEEPPPLSNYFDTLSRSPPPLPNQYNLDAPWPKTLPPDPSSTAGTGSLSSAHLFSATNQAQNRFPQPASSSPASLSYAPLTENGPRGPAPPAEPPRNPKKRSRASRRAPTTVLTTDTTNFRAMVQEFTGIPAPPFTASPFPRSRLDLFGASSAIRLGHLDSSSANSTPSFLLRPFAQKLQHPGLPPALFVSSADPAGPSGHASAAMLNTTPHSFDLPASQNNPSNPFHMQSPLVSFQSLLQNNKYSLSAAPPDALDRATASSKVPSAALEMEPSEIRGLEEFGLGCHGLDNGGGGGVSMGLSSETAPSLRDGVDKDLTNRQSGNWGDNGGGDFRVNGSCGNSSQRLCNGKACSFAPSASFDFRGDKPLPENVSCTRSEGMVESWICSSD